MQDSKIEKENSINDKPFNTNEKSGNISDLGSRLNKNSNMKKRIRDLPISRFIPNMLTIFAICAGFSSIKFILIGQINISISCILIAVILDGTDGRIARLLQKESHFGAELDSLADFLNFGIAPSLLVFIASLKYLGNVGWAMSLFLTICCGLRLARFNTNKFYEDTPEDYNRHNFESNYSIGVAAPAGAMIALTPAFFYLATDVVFFMAPISFVISTFLAGVLMISKIHTFVFKRVRVTDSMVPVFIVAFCLFMIAFFTAFWESICAFIIVYLISIPFSERLYRRKVKEFD